MTSVVDPSRHGRCDAEFGRSGHNPTLSRTHLPCNCNHDFFRTQICSVCAVARSPPFGQAPKDPHDLWEGRHSFDGPATSPSRASPRPYARLARSVARATIATTGTPQRQIGQCGRFGLTVATNLGRRGQTGVGLPHVSEIEGVRGSTVRHRKWGVLRCHP